MKSVSQWQEPHARASWFDRQQSSLFQFRFRPAQRPYQMAADRVRTEIAGAELHHAWSGAVRGSQNRAEIQVVGQDDVIVGDGVCHDICVGASGSPTEAQCAASMPADRRKSSQFGERFISISSFTR